MNRNGDKTARDLRRTLTALTIAIAAALAFSVPASFARTPQNPPPPTRNLTKTLLVSGAHRECFSLGDTQRLHYKYQAEASLEFKLVRQQGDQVTEVRQAQVANASGDFVPREAGDYCMTWRNNGQKTVTLRFWYQRLKR